MKGIEHRFILSVMLQVEVPAEDESSAIAEVRKAIKTGNIGVIEVTDVEVLDNECLD